MRIKVKTPAKINLILEILKKREDGFHEIQSIMQAVSLYDYLTIEVEEPVFLTGEELSNFKNIKELRKTAHKYYHENIQGKIVEHLLLGTIKFTKAGRDETLFRQPKTALIFPKLLDIVKESRYIKTEPPYHKRDDGITKFHIFENNVSIYGKIKKYEFLIGEDAFGYKFYLSKENGLDSFDRPQRTGAIESNINITDNEEIFNPKNEKLNPIPNIIELSGNSDQIPYDKTNLVYKAAELFLKKANLKGFKIKIYIEKNIPVAAGLAGGSSNAAGTLWGLNKLFDNILTSFKINSLASQMGSDINFCLEGGTQIATSRGEILSKISTPDLDIVIIKPKNLFISAGEAYAKYTNLSQKPEIKKLEEIKSAIYQNNSDKIAEFLDNHLEKAIIPDYPEIQEIKDYLIKKGCKNTLMSGSGSSVFGICQGELDLSDAKSNWECFKEKTINFGIK